MKERGVRFEVSGTELVGVLTPGSSSRRGVVIVPPMGEEKKFAHATLAALARALAEAGLWVLRMDLSGTGDSFGEFRQARLEGWRREVSAAVEALARESGVRETALMGLRLGASLAWLTRKDMPASDVVMWEPVLDGKGYLQSLWQRKLVREMMTAGRGRSGWSAAKEEMKRQGYVDLDGWDLGPGLVADLEGMDLEKEVPPSPARTLCVQIAFNGKVSAGLEQFAGNIRRAGGHADTVAVKERAIWDRVETVESAELIRVTTGWLAWAS